MWIILHKSNRFENYAFQLSTMHCIAHGEIHNHPSICPPSAPAIPLSNHTTPFISLAVSFVRHRIGSGDNICIRFGWHIFIIHTFALHPITYCHPTKGLCNNKLNSCEKVNTGEWHIHIRSLTIIQSFNLTFQSAL